MNSYFIFQLLLIPYFTSAFSNPKTLNLIQRQGLFFQHFTIKDNRGMSMSLTAQNQGKMGLHGTGSRFLPVHQLKSDEITPRIIQIAGVYPGLSVEEFIAPLSSPGPELGCWQYDFTDPEGPQMGTVALPGSAITQLLVDPVILISSNLALGIDFGAEETEVLVCVDRDITVHQPNKFFVWKNAAGEIEIRWMENVPIGYEVLGQVMLVTIPHLATMAPAKTGFLEADDEL